MSTSSAARERINALLDENSFVEIGALVSARATDFNLKQIDTPSDGCITGYGVINDSLVYVYAQDASVLNGSIGEMHAKKICNIYDMAMKMGAPVIGLIDSCGLFSIGMLVLAAPFSSRLMRPSGIWKKAGNIVPPLKTKE